MIHYGQIGTCSPDIVHAATANKSVAAQPRPLSLSHSNHLPQRRSTISSYDRCGLAPSRSTERQTALFISRFATGINTLSLHCSIYILPFDLIVSHTFFNMQIKYSPDFNLPYWNPYPLSVGVSPISPTSFSFPIFPSVCFGPCWELFFSMPRMFRLLLFVFSVVQFCGFFLQLPVRNESTLILMRVWCIYEFVSNPWSWSSSPHSLFAKQRHHFCVRFL